VAKSDMGWPVALQGLRLRMRPWATKIILGKELKGLCNTNFFCGRNWVWFHDPDEMTIDRIKKLLEWEKRARDEAASRIKL